MPIQPHSTRFAHPLVAPAVDGGLYDAANERDACGVGFIVHIKGERSHDIITSGLEILVNLSHRGACGCDPRTGDGCGILTQMPDEFLRTKTAEIGFALPPAGQYGAGAVFLPRDAAERRFCQERLEEIIREEGQTFLGWREVPVDSGALGWLAQSVEPAIRQVFIARGDRTPDDMFEWKLFVIRKRIENEVRGSAMRDKRYFYIPSLSSRVLIYKGLMQPEQAEGFYRDLSDESYVSALALVHQRYSTNTFPTWDLAHPFRYLAHNGEINTLRGNVNWMHAREGILASEKYGPDLKKIFPICTPKASDSAIFDNVLELLVVTGRSLPQAMSMLIPEPWAGHESMPDDSKAYYEYQACLLEPWDGPASMAFTDGTMIGACLDRNGLRPSRYWVTKGGYVVMASGVGRAGNAPRDASSTKGVCGRGGCCWSIRPRDGLSPTRRSSGAWPRGTPIAAGSNENQIRLDDLPDPLAPKTNGQHAEPLVKLQRTFGYTLEDLRILIGPMATDAQEPVGSMGNDTPLAVLSDRPQLLYNYFKQLFAQVTNPPLDAIREEIITSMITTIGAEGNLLDETPEQCGLLRLERPIIGNGDLAKIKQLDCAAAQEPHAVDPVPALRRGRGNAATLARPARRGFARPSTKASRS